MIRKLGPLAAILMLTAAFAAGCGDDDKSDSSGSDAPAVTAEDTATATDDTATDDAATDDSSGGGTDLSDNPQVKAAIEQCKQSVDNNPQVKDDIKDDIKAICDDAASGDPDDVKQAIKDVCVKIVESSVPEGDIRDQALQSCETAG
jgi:hypothetical protein